MKCAFCGWKETKVTDKRDSEETTRRRRQCLSCGKRFTTYERSDVNVIVVKKDGRRERFDRQKLLGGLLKACEKRPVSQEAVEKAASEIETELRTYGTEVPTRAIGELVMEKLKDIDKVAYIRFASVYRAFSDISAFEKEVKLLKRHAIRS